MDSFGFDFAGGDLLDLGSLGMWGGNTTPLGSSPNGGGGGGLPFSVGTPTGVQSLGDEPFSSLPPGNDDFNFVDSPKASPGTRKSGNDNNNSNDDLTSPYFGSELEPSGADQSSENSTGNGKAEDASSAAKDQGAAGQQRKPGSNEVSAPTSSTSSSSTTANNSASDPSGISAYVMPDQNNNSASSGQRASFQNNAKPSASPGSASAATRNATSSGTSSTGAPSSGTATSTSAAPASTNASSARPHIDGPGSAAPSPSGRAAAAAAHHHQQQQQQQAMAQQRYPNQNPNAMMSQASQPGQPNFAGQAYQSNAQGNPVIGGPQQPPANGQYMQPQYRAPTSSYDEEFMRVKAMMMQHPDLIPPPMEVLRISMSQGAPNQAMMGPGANYMQRPGQVMNRVGTNGYPQYGAPNPNMMMAPQAQQPGMDANRMRAMQLGQQQQQQQQPQQRQMPPQARTPGGSNSASPDTQAAWQSENDLPLRRKMIGKIVSLLQQRKPDAPAEWIRRLPDMARRLEDSLYRTAKNRDEYGDFSSLKTRLQHLAVTMGARAQHKAGNPRPGGVMPNGAGMIGGAAVPTGMAVNPAAMGAGMAPQGHVVGNMQYANVGGRMTQQQLLQQQHLQMQMQNPQMRQQFTPQQMQQFTPQQMQQFQAAQLQRRQFQMQQAQQQAQLQRQTSMQQQQQQQQFQQNQAMQRQNNMRQQQQMQQPGANVGYPMDPANKQQQMNQRGQNANFMQQQQAQAQNAQLQRRGSMNGTNAAGRLSADMGLGPGLGAESADFLNLDLSQSLLGDADLQVDASSLGGGNPGAGDALKNPADPSVAGVKRTLSQSQQQMAAAANAAAFKRTKAGGPGAGAAGNRGPSTQSPQPTQNAMQKPVQGSSGSSKTPPMSTVNAK